MGVEQVKKVFPNVKLILSGHKKNNFQIIFELIKNLKLQKNIKFLGYINDEKKFKLYRDVTALINPSVCGPTNIPQLEAFNSNCPVLVADIFASREQCGNAALYFDPRSPSEISKAIIKIFTNKALRKKLINHGKVKRNKFSLINFTNNLKTIINL